MLVFCIKYVRVVESPLGLKLVFDIFFVVKTFDKHTYLIKVGAVRGIRTLTGLVLNQFPLPLGYRSMGCTTGFEPAMRNCA